MIAAPRAWLVTRRDAPLYRNGYALILDSGLTSVLGLAYWLVSARMYSAAAVGVGAALISAMTLLANLSQLNLKSALNRFLPSAGTASVRLVLASYALSLAVAAVAAAVFVAGLRLWSPDLGFLADRPWLAVWFGLAAMAWTVFVLQDSVLVGIRQAPWVPAANLAYAVVKLALLVLVAGTAPTLGVFVAWTAPLLAMLVPVHGLLFARLIPRHVDATRARQEQLRPRAIARYVAADYGAYAIAAATIGILPLLVLGTLGAESTAHWFVAWSIGYALYLIPGGMGMSLIAEASLNPATLAAQARQTLAESARLVVVAVVGTVIVAGPVLHLLGEGYAREATSALRLLAVSAIPWTVVAVAMNVARVQRRMRSVVWINAALHGLVLALALALTGPLGVTGLGWAWLLAQTAVAVAIVAGPQRELWLAEAIAAAIRVRARLAALRNRWTAARVAPVLAELRLAHQHRRDWEIQGDVPTVNDVVVCTLGPAGGAPGALLKRARGDRAGPSLINHARTLRALRRVPGLAAWTRLVPGLLADGEVGGRAFVVESFLPGVPGSTLVDDERARDRLVRLGYMAIAPLHNATATERRVDDFLLQAWVHEPLSQLRPVLPGRPGAVAGGHAGEAVARLLRGGLVGRRLRVGRIHGDLCPANLLLTPQGDEVTGLIDWERSRPEAPVDLDVIHLMLTTRMAAEKRELGDVVAELLRASELAPWTRTLVLLTWLHHIAANLDKAARYRRSPLWRRRNLYPVLAAAVAVESVAPAAALRRPSARPRLGAVPAMVARRGTALGLATLGLGVGLWTITLRAVDPRAMSDIGLVSVLPNAFFTALALLTASFATLVHTRRHRPALLGAHLIVLIALLHATPAIVYGTLRYSWSWKHVGIVDYIARHGSVNRSIETLDVYHNWPGFFGVDSLLNQLAGLPDAIAAAVWAPLLFNVLNLLGVLFLVTGLTGDRRIVWSAAWLYFVASWVGQDYFAPQALAFFEYLMVLGVAVRHRPGAGWTLPVGVVLIVMIAVTHPLTGVMTPLALVALAVSGHPVRLLAVASVAITATWDLVFAWPFVGPNIHSALESIGWPWSTTESSLAATQHLSSGQALVAVLARLLVGAMLVLAAVGAVRAWRAKRLSRAAVVLALAPGLLFATGDYDGEILFRIYLFGLPFLAFLGAHAFLAQAAPLRRGVAFGATAAALLTLFLFAYYGKERQYHFSAEEVSASKFLYSHAPAGSLFIEGTRNYPGQFKRYEKFTYVPLSLEPVTSQVDFVAAPVEVFSKWMSDPRYSAAYLVITRSQKAEVNEVGGMEPGSLEQIERVLLASTRFRAVARNRDAVIFALADPPGATP